MLRWYLIQTKPAGESIAQSHLERQGYEVYCPRLAKLTRRHGHWKDRIVALFPRYLFLRLDEGRQSLAPACSTVGVTATVRFGHEYATVPEHVIDHLRGREDAATGLHRLNEGSLCAGMPVRVITGPFEGLEGIFERKAGAERVMVLLNLLGQGTRVRVPLDCVVRSRAFA